MKLQNKRSIRPWIAVVLVVVVLASSTARAQQAESHRYFTTDFSLKNVDIAKLTGRLNRVGVNIPLNVKGKATFHMKIEVPIDALRNAKAYRFHGELSSPSLEAGNLEMQNVAMVVSYRDGVMTLEPLTFQIPDDRPNAPPPGTFRGTGRMQLVPRGELTLNLQADGISARAMANVFSTQSPVSGGVLSGRVEGSVPAEKARDVAAWNVDGQFSAADVEALGRVLQTASFQLAARGGDLKIKGLTAKMQGANLSGTAQANLTGKQTYASDLKLSITDLAKLLPLSQTIQATKPLSASAHITGTLSPLTYLATGHASLPATKIGRIKVASGQFDFSLDPKAAAVKNLQVALYDGRINGSATLPRQGERPASLEVRLQPPLNLHEAAQGISGKDLPLNGEITGNIQRERAPPEIFGSLRVGRIRQRVRSRRHRLGPGDSKRGRRGEAPEGDFLAFQNRPDLGRLLAGCLRKIPDGQPECV